MSSAVVRSAGGNNSGFVSWSRASGHAISFEGCVFNGKLLQIDGSGSSNGGFIGWTGSNKTVTFTNCLCVPAALADGETMAGDNSATFARGWNATTTATNGYYATALGSTQGKQLRSIEAGNYVNTGLSGTAKTYSVSGITAYLNSDNSFNAGLIYNNVMYAGNGDEVNLTLTNTPPTGYVFSGYTVNPNGATLTGSDNSYMLTMPDANVSGLTAYVASSISGNTLTLTSVEKVPAGTGLLLKGEAGKHFTVHTTGSAAAVGNNLLVGLTEETDVSQTTADGTAFILANGNHGINWYRLAEDHYTLKANSAYLRLSASVAPSASRSLTMVFEDSTTGVTTASSLNGGEWYDLNGRKLFKKPTRKGLYIFNGRKTLIVYGRCKKGGGMHAVIPKSFVPLHP